MKGDKLRIYHQLIYLSEHYNIILCCTTDVDIPEEQINELKQYCSEIHLFRLDKIGLFIQLVVCLFSQRPFQVAYFFRYRHLKRIQRILTQHKPNHIYCQLVRVSEYVKDYHFCKKTLDYMDVLSVGMERRVTTEPFYKRWFYRMEHKRLSRYEGRIFDYFEHKLIISEQDRQFIMHPKRNDIHIIKNGVDESFFQTMETPQTYDLVFTGNLSYPPNIEAAVFLSIELLPALKTSGYPCTLLISGVSPTKRILDLKSCEGVTLTGWVNDIRESYAKAAIFVAPMFIGTGLQNKLLEAMAMGLPCITTSLANNALGGKNNENILLAEDIHSFVEKVILLKIKKNIFTQVSINGREFVKQNYTWSNQNRHLYDVMRDKLSS